MSDLTITLLDHVGTGLVGVAIGYAAAVIQQRRRAARDEPLLARVAVIIVVTVSLASGVISYATELRGNQTANCLNAVLGKRNSPQSRFAAGFDDYYAGLIDFGQFRKIVHDYRQASANHPLGHC